MTARPLIRLAVLVAAVCLAPALAAQERDATVPAAGVLRVQVMGENISLVGRFTEAGRESPFAPWQAPLTADLVPAVGALRDRVDAFLAETGDPADPQLLADLSLGTMAAEGRGDRREMPVTLELGLPAGLSVGVRGSVVRRETVVHGLRLAGGTVGQNPDPAGNAALLGQVDGAHEGLAGSALLPVAGSAAGEALQARVRAHTGEELTLPEAPADAALLASVLAGNGLSPGPLQPAGETYGPGDGEVFVRYRIPGSLAPGAIAPEGFAWRAAVGAAVILPTGRMGPEAMGHHIVPRDGRSGVRAEAAADLVLPHRLRLGSELRWTIFGEEDRAPDGFGLVPHSDDDGWRPGSLLELSLLPRFQILPAIGLSAGYRLTSRGGGGAVRDPFAGTRHDGVLAVTFRAAEAGVPVAQWPIDAGLAWRRTLTGSGGGWDIRGMDVWVRVHAPLWGR